MVSHSFFLCIVTAMHHYTQVDPGLQVSGFNLPVSSYKIESIKNQSKTTTNMFSVCVRRDIHTPLSLYTYIYLYMYFYIHIFICMYMHMLKITYCLSIRCTMQSYLGCSTSRAVGSCLLSFAVSLSVSLYLTRSDYVYLNICTCILQTHIDNFKISPVQTIIPYGFGHFSFSTIQ